MIHHDLIDGQTATLPPEQSDSREHPKVEDQLHRPWFWIVTPSLDEERWVGRWIEMDYSYGVVQHLKGIHH